MKNWTPELQSEAETRLRSEMDALADRIAETGENSCIAGRAIGLSDNRARWVWRSVRVRLGAQAI